MAQETDDTEDMFPDLLSGWFDNTKTQQREYWSNGASGRFARRNAIVPHSPHEELRAPWGSLPDRPENKEERAA